MGYSFWLSARRNFESALFAIDGSARARDTEYFADFFERLPVPAVETKTLGNDFLLPIVECSEQAVDLLVQI